MQPAIDELPVGSSSNSNQPEEFAPDSASAPAADTSGPLDQRLVSKVWNVRAQAFEELTSLFKFATSKHDEAFREHASSFGKYLQDANPGALEKVLDSLEAFTDKCDSKVVAANQNDYIKALVEKCVGHMKPTIKQKGLDCFNFQFEVTE